MLQKTFLKLLSNYTANENLQLIFWDEIKKHYAYKNRYYHNLQHLENILNQLSEIKTEINNWNVILFSLFYHDVIYDVSNTINEEESAELAIKRMSEISVSENEINLCNQIILATKSHVISTNSDINYFTDADLSVLGQPCEIYSNYYKNIRKEYAFYSEAVYNSGRKKVLKHFLEMERIFKTDFFYDKFEIQAKINLQNEFNTL